MCTGNEAVLWVRVGDAGEYESFDSLDDAIDYLNDLRVGCVEGWLEDGFVTPNYHGRDYISMYWGGPDANHWADLDDDEQETVEDSLEENYL